LRNRISGIFKTAVSAVLIFYLFYYLIDYRDLTAALGKSDPGYILLSTVFFVMSLLAAAYRWQYVIAIQKRKIKYSAALREYMIGSFFNNFLPGSIGGDVSRIVGAAKETGSKEVALSSVFVERLIGLISLIVIGLIGLMFLDISSEKGFIYISVILLSGLCLALFIMINRTANTAAANLIGEYLPQKISEVIVSYLKDFSGYSESVYKLFVVFTISFAFKIFDGFFIFFIFKSMGVNLTYAHAVALFSIINVIKMIPLSLNGLGLSAISWVLILKNFGIEESTAASIDFLTVTVSIIISGYGGILYFLARKTKKTA
jgi:glycosyltransferase 2 family protein